MRVRIGATGWCGEGGTSRGKLSSWVLACLRGFVVAWTPYSRLRMSRLLSLVQLRCGFGAVRCGAVL